jgi:DNA polymerase III gamma/tau subunit
MEGNRMVESLITKYRPKTLDDVVGNEATKKTLRELLDKKAKRSFMFIGERGCGKTTLGLVVGNEVGSKEIFEYNTANTRGIDTIRGIDEDCRYAPLEGSCKVYILDECHKLTNEAQNALLKLTEKPPPRVYFILCTTDQSKLIKTLSDEGRVTKFEVEKLTYPNMSLILDTILEKEKATKFPRVAKREIIKQADGIPRKAIAILEKVIGFTDEKEILEILKDLTIDDTEVIDLCRLLIKPYRPGKWKQVASILKGLTEEPEDIRAAVQGYVKQVMFGNDIGTKTNLAHFVLTQFNTSFMYSREGGLVDACYKVMLFQIKLQREKKDGL